MKNIKEVLHYYCKESPSELFNYLIEHSEDNWDNIGDLKKLVNLSLVLESLSNEIYSYVINRCDHSNKKFLGVKKDCEECLDCGAKRYFGKDEEFISNGLSWGMVGKWSEWSYKGWG